MRDRVWQTRTQLELAILEYAEWFSNRRLQESLDDIPPVEFEELGDGNSHAFGRPGGGRGRLAKRRRTACNTSA